MKPQTDSQVPVYFVALPQSLKPPKVERDQFVIFARVTTVKCTSVWGMTGNLPSSCWQCDGDACCLILPSSCWQFDGDSFAGALPSQL